MKRYLLSVALLCLVATGAQSFWQSRQQVAITAGGVGPPTFVFQAQQNSSTFAADVATIPATSIGAASANRRVGIFVDVNAGSGASIVSATIGGVSCDTITSAIYLDLTSFRAAFWISAIVPTGTTAGATVNFSPGTVSAVQAGLPFYTVDNTTLASPTSPTTKGTSAGAVSSITGDVATLAGSSVLMFGGPVGGTPSGVTITASDAGLTTTNSFGVTIGGMANGASASAANHATLGWTGTSGTANIAMVAYR